MVDSATSLPTDTTGSVVVTGSHGGRYAAALVLRAEAIGALFNDAAVGRDGAGIAGLRDLERAGIAAATVDYRTAWIGEGASTAEGRVSAVNRCAAALGCRPGQRASDCIGRLRLNEPQSRAERVEAREARTPIPFAAGRAKIFALDSAALATDNDSGAVLLTGSHGGLVGGRAETALRTRALLAAFNDAGGGDDGRGTNRLPALDDAGVAAVTVYAGSARIGDGRSTYADGRVSHANQLAAEAGAREGMTMKRLVEIVREREAR